MPTATADLRADAEPTAPGASARIASSRIASSRIASSLSASLERVLPSGSFVAFRVAFGLVAAVGQARFLARGWVDEFYLAPANHLTYPGFSWVQPLAPIAMYALVIGLVLLGLLIAGGVRTRTCAALFALGFGYCELIDAALYLNHYWYLTLAAVVLAIVPGPRGGQISAVSVWAVRGQLAVVYVFAGIAKINSDWLLRAEPLHTWLSVRTDRPIIGSLLDESAVAFACSWAGAAFDLTIVGFLLWKRSRPLAYGVLVMFHMATAMLFQIGMFPWVMIALTPIFFAPDWTNRLIGRTRLTDRSERQRTAPSASHSKIVRPARLRRPALVALAVLAVVNIALPLRHVFADGNVRWNDDGYTLSWRVMLTERATHVVFHVTDPSTGTVSEVPAEIVLEDWQSAAAMVRADLILTTAHLIADEARPTLGADVEVRVDAFVAWNGRLRERWIDPTVDLAALDRSASADEYVLRAP